MNNIQFIQEDYTVGDAIRISCSLGVKEGYIMEFMEDRIKLRPYEMGRKPFSVQNSTITDWEEGVPSPHNSVETLPGSEKVLTEDTLTTTNQEACINNLNNFNEMLVGLDTNITADSFPQPEDKNESKIIQQKQPEIHVDVNPQDSAQNYIREERSKDTHQIDSQNSMESLHINPVGFISPEELLQRDPGLRKKKKMTNIGKDFSALAHLVSEADKINHEKYIPAKGEIVLVSSTYGFIYDSELRKKIFFSKSQIIDPEIKLHQAYELPVVYQVINGEKGPKAIWIHKSAKIGRLFQLCDELLNNGKTSAAVGILNNILNVFPDNEEAIRRKKSIQPEVATKSLINTALGENFYRKAERANHILKNYEQAIEYYIKAIEVGDRTESAIKDLCSLMLAMYKSDQNPLTRDRALSTVSKYKKMLSYTNVTNLNFLEAFYFSIEDFFEYDKVLDILFDHSYIKKDKKKQSYLYAREAATFIKRQEFDNAKAAIEDALLADPSNKGVVKLQQVLDNPQLMNEETLSSLFSANDFVQLNNGLSSFIQNTLSDYNEFHGVPESIKVDPSKFSKSTLKGVRELIATMRGRSRERAKYLLTEAKLLSILEPDNITDIKKSLILYCNSMAITHLSEESHMDVVRFYYNEAFALSNDNYRALATQVSNAILTYIYSNERILTQKTKTMSVGDVIEIAREQLKYPVLWDALLEISLNNREISAHVVDFLFKSPKSKSEVIRYINEYHSATKCSLQCDEQTFRMAWDAAREHRTNSLATFGNKFKLFVNQTIESIPDLFLNVTNNLPAWLPSLDIQRLNAIRDRIVPAIDAYIKSSGYRNKETNYFIIEGHLNQLIADIEEQPTHISYNYILPLSALLKASLNTSFDDVKMASEPKLRINLLSTETVINEDNIVSFQVSLSNDKASSPIRKIHIYVKEEEGVVFIPTSETERDYNALDGGDEKVYRVSVKIDQAHVSAQALPINIVVEYETAGNTKYFTQQISLKLYSPSEFISIENPYAPLADGGPVVDSSMFFGRQSFIENIVDAFKRATSKQVIIYGQKRCGKSSVLYHLKDVLQSEGSFFCVCFSIGDILKNLSEFSFYHKILSTIQIELEMLQFEYPEMELPEFNIPSLNEFKDEDTDNPLNTFSKYIRLFKNKCKKICGWQDKKLVIMIDEFTYLYTGIKQGRISDSIMKQWKAITQNPITQFSVVLIGQDVIPAFKREDYARNAFGVIQDIRLTYLNDTPARELIENPIRMPDGKSRYVGRAVERIIEYTSRNPYYIQIFCARLVEYLNQNKSIYITEADVNSVASSFIAGDQALEDDKFDNLIRAGESEDLQEFKDEDVLALLKQMASLANLIGFCRKQDLDILKDPELTNCILANLTVREVIEQMGEDRYKIQVKLFQEWLLNH